MVCAGVLGSISGLSWGALWCLGVVYSRCVPQSANGWRVTIYCVRACVFAHVDGLFFLARGHKTHPKPSLVSKGDGQPPPTQGPPRPSPPCPACCSYHSPEGMGLGCAFQPKSQGEQNRPLAWKPNWLPFAY